MNTIFGYKELDHILEKGYIRYYKFFNLRKLGPFKFRWDFQRKKNGKILYCYSEAYDNLAKCKKDLDSFYALLVRTKNVEEIITSQRVKVRMFEKITR